MIQPTSNHQPQAVNLIDRIVGYLNPAAGLQRFGARSVLNQVAAAGKPHEAAEPSRMRKFATDAYGPNTIVGLSAAAVRAQAGPTADGAKIAAMVKAALA